MRPLTKHLVRKEHAVIGPRVLSLLRRRHRCESALESPPDKQARRTTETVEHPRVVPEQLIADQRCARTSPDAAVRQLCAAQMPRSKADPAVVVAP
jgi:hypothetical protein